MTVGRAGTWVVDGQDVAELHGYLYYDGQTLFVQSAVPNAIGDSLSYGGCGVFHDDFFNQTISVCQAGGQFKAIENNSAIPRCRYFYNFHHFDSALTADNAGAEGNDLFPVASATRTVVERRTTISFDTAEQNMKIIDELVESSGASTRSQLIRVALRHVLNS